MDQVILNAVCRIIIGPTGRRIPAYPDITAAYCGLFADYIEYTHCVSAKTLYKYARASTPYPHFLACHYAGSNGYRRNLSDMMGLVDSCTSIILLQQIQAEVCQWAEAHLLPDVAAAINRNYIAHNPSRREIAVYLADVMHHALNAENAANRPTDSTSIL